MEISDNQKITLTIGQLRGLICEKSDMKNELSQCVQLFFNHCTSALEDVPEKTIYRVMSNIAKALHEFSGESPSVDKMIKHYVDVCCHKPYIHDTEKQSTVEAFFLCCRDSVLESAFGDAYDELETEKQVNADTHVHRLLKKIRNIIARNGDKESVKHLDFCVNAFRDASSNAD